MQTSKSVMLVLSRAKMPRASYKQVVRRLLVSYTNAAEFDVSSSAHLR